MDVETETSNYGDITRRDAKDIAAYEQEQAVRIKRASAEHANCPGRPGYDPELGYVCYCGKVMEGPGLDDVLNLPQRPPSLTSEAAAKATALVVPEETSSVRDSAGISSAVSPADPILARVDVIDPSMPYDSKMVEEHILDAIARHERGAHYERVCVEDVYDKTMVYEFALKRATLKARDAVGGGDVNERRAWTELQCEAEYVNLMIAKMKLDAIKSTMHSLRSNISGYQSIAKSIASAYTATRNDNSGPRF